MPEPAESGPRPCDPDDERPPRGGLTADELVALQLTAQGYAPPQIAWLRGHALALVERDLAAAAAALGATDVRCAVAAARRRRVID